MKGKNETKRDLFSGIRITDLIWLHSHKIVSYDAVEACLASNKLLILLLRSSKFSGNTSAGRELVVGEAHWQQVN